MAQWMDRYEQRSFMAIDSSDNRVIGQQRSKVLTTILNKLNSPPADLQERAHRFLKRRKPSVGDRGLGSVHFPRPVRTALDDRALSAVVDDWLSRTLGG